MKSCVFAESLRIAVASLLLATGSVQVLADTNASPSSPSTGTSAPPLNPASVFTRMFGGTSSTDGSGTREAPRRHRRSHRASPTDPASGSAATASWAPQSSAAAAPRTATATAAAESSHETTSAPIASTFSKAPAESRVSDWLPSSDNVTASEETISTSARIDLIAEKYGKQATVDFNSRIQEANGVIAFRAIDNQTGERETIRIDRTGDIKLKSGWPE